ncbi:MAG: hypothetical protein KF915_16065 [Polyangiaceae bacterium]|nr:hypothetical protein [Polyangiaceae bacterium]
MALSASAHGAAPITARMTPSPLIAQAASGAAPPGSASAPGKTPDAPASPTPGAADPPSDQAAACKDTKSALGGLGCELRAALGAQSAALVMHGELVTDLTIPRSEALAARLTRVVAGALGARVHSGAVPRGAAELTARSARRFVYLELRLTRHALEVSADVYEPARGFWARVRAEASEPKAHAFATRPIDAELRSFLPSLPLVASAPLKVPSPEAEVVALACGDLDGDQAPELAVVGRGAIQVGRVRGGRFVASASRPWRALSPLAPAPLREPIGSARIQSGLLDVGSSDRARGLRLNPDLSPRLTLAAPIPWPGHGCVNLYEHWLGREEVACAPEDDSISLPGYDHRGDTLAGARLVDAEGRLRSFRALRGASTRRADLKSERGTASVPEVGAQLTMGDLDGDGVPEIVASLPTRVAKDDALVVYSWREPSPPKERLRLPAPGGVRAVTACPAEATQRGVVVAAVGSELWLFQ